ncbi:6-carboxytetrahydropterin synthase [Sphaerobacter sp.]|uniref:6-pyruvoyl trahydropterin synthase family protein n=1 Tax=Sphaerobacter sp. TaxID=2099654 RepID=UPI001DB702C3|nr:6-carboxytetrahydropterin synthase [Sphaerobacter sp.]MBX5444210.1 6-carboxytetrahydropterin synthase [Sphaerobacter sp.]
MFAIGVVAQFEAAHRLRGDFGPASRLHGHTYRVEVEVAGPQLNDDGTLFDLGLLRAWVDEAVGELHYQNLDDLPAFAQRNSTAEEVARFLRETLAPRLHGKGLRMLTVRVWESPQAYAACQWELL